MVFSKFEAFRVDSGGRGVWKVSRKRREKISFDWRRCWEYSGCVFGGVKK